MSIEWTSQGTVGEIYVLTKRDLDRVGHSWMEGRLRVGDVVMCASQSGDNFYEYILLERGENFVKGIPESSFGAYVFESEPLEFQFTMKQYHLLMAGQYLQSEAGTIHPLVQIIRNLKEKRGKSHEKKSKKNKKR